jgi:hypothetical protein
MAGDGVTTIGPLGTLEVGGILDGRTLVNRGSAEWNIGHWYMDNGAVFRNEGRFDVWRDTGGYNLLGWGPSSTGTFDNTGTFVKWGAGNIGIAHDFLNRSIAFNNSGTVEVAGGWLSLLGGGVSDGSPGAPATFEVAEGAGLGFHYELYTFDEDTSIRGAGSVYFSGTATMAGTYEITGATSAGGSIDFSGTVISVGSTLGVSGSADLHDTDLTTSTVNLSGTLICGDLDVSERMVWRGTMAGDGVTTIGPLATLEIGGILDERTLINYGAATWPGGRIQLSNGSVFNNFGTLTAEEPVAYSIIWGNGTFNNYGTLVSSRGEYSSNIEVPFNNCGTVEVASGALRVYGEYTHSAGETRLSGGSISSSTPLDIQGGSLTGSGPIYGNVINRGLTVPGMSAGGIGTIYVSGDYVQPAVAEAGGPYEVIEGESVQLAGSVSGSRGVLDIEIGGLDPGFFDQLQVGGSVKLGGVLNLSLVNGFVPTVGETFTIVDNLDASGVDPVVGVFAGLDEGAVFTVGGSKFQITYQGGTGNDVVLTIVDPGTPNQGGTTLGYEWDLDGDGVFGEPGEFGLKPIFSAADLVGPAEVIVTLRLTDATGLAEQDEAKIYVLESPAPVAGIAGPTDGVRGQPRTFLLTAVDSRADEAAGFTFQINWGDGTTQTIDPTPGNGAGTAVDHVYTEIGTYTVTVTATDQGGLVSDPVSHSLTITVWAIQPSPCDPLKTVLAVGGTLTGDHIVFHPGEAPGDVTVELNGVTLGTFRPTCAVMAFGQAGDDDIQVAGAIDLVAWLYGGADNDRLKGGAGHDLLFGEDGDDLLVGNSGRDLLIGGIGADRIVGNADDDILIAGWTDFDTNDAALCAIMAEWTNVEREPSLRVANLRGEGSGPRLNEDYFLQNGVTVFDDAARDVLTGSAGLDWFLSGDSEDKVTDLSDQEFADVLDFILQDL